MEVSTQTCEIKTAVIMPVPRTLTEEEKMELKRERDRAKARRYYETHKEQTTARVLRHYYKKMAEAIEKGEKPARGRGRPRKNVEDKVKDLMEQERVAIQRDMESRARIMTRAVA